MDCKATVFYDGKYRNFVAPSTLQLWALLHYILNQQRGVFDDVVKFCSPQKEGVIVDIGAAIGQSVVVYSPVFPGRKFVCIEPTEYNLKYLRENTKEYDVEIIKAAAGERRGWITISYPDGEQRTRADIKENSGLLTGYGRGETVEKIEARPLDEILGDTKVFYLDLDVEGMEFDVISGAKKMLARDRPYIHIEIDYENQKMGGRKPEVLVNLLYELDYVKALGLHNNFLFIPKEERDLRSGNRK